MRSKWLYQDLYTRFFPNPTDTEDNLSWIMIHEF